MLLALSSLPPRPSRSALRHAAAAAVRAAALVSICSASCCCRCRPYCRARLDLLCVMLLPLSSLLPRPSCCCRGRLDAAAAVVPHPDPAPVSAPRSARSSSCAPSHPPCAICTPPPPVFPYNYPFKPIIVKLSLQSPHYRRHQCESGRFRVGPPSRFSELALRVISPSRPSESFLRVGPPSRFSESFLRVVYPSRPSESCLRIGPPSRHGSAWPITLRGR